MMREYSNDQIIMSILCYRLNACLFIISTRKQKPCENLLKSFTASENRFQSVLTFFQWWKITPKNSTVKKMKTEKQNQVNFYFSCSLPCQKGIKQWILIHHGFMQKVHFLVHLFFSVWNNVNGGWQHFGGICKHFKHLAAQLFISHKVVREIRDEHWIWLWY